MRTEAIYGQSNPLEDYYNGEDVEEDDEDVDEDDEDTCNNCEAEREEFHNFCPGCGNRYL